MTPPYKLADGRTAEVFLWEDDKVIQTPAGGIRL